ncbi:MAG: NAD(+) synthase [Rikenellaceae bacterium]
MKIAIPQLNYTIGDIDGNTTKIINAINRAKEESADLVIFAEQAISGLPAFDLLTKTTFLELCEEALRKIAQHCDTIDALVGLPLLTSEGTLSVAAHINRKNVVKYISKHFITARREMGFLVSGKGCDIISVAGENCLVVIGDDMRRVSTSDSKVDHIISINARRYSKGILSYRFEAMRNLAFVSGKDVIIVNQIGGASDIVYDGSSGAFNADGKLSLLLNSFEEDFGIYDTANPPQGMDNPPFVSYNHRNMMIYKASCLGLKDFFEKTGYKKACIGLSGGIDSAVIATLAVTVLGKENVMALMMPSKFSSKSSIDDAIELANRLGIEYSVIPITTAYDTILGVMKPAIGGMNFDITEENMQSRIRTMMLMALQNKRGFILLNSSNKSENALGMNTLYGDTAGAISITGDLYKGEVYDLARYINKVTGDVIPDAILEKEPSSELYANQKDTDIIPPYEVVDAILYRMIEKGQHREEIVNAGFDYAVVEKIHSMLMNSEKKRFQFPPVLRLSNCTFGHERLMPLTHKYGF